MTTPSMAMERVRRYKSGVARCHETIFDGDGEGERGREDIRVGLRDGTRPYLMAMERAREGEKI